MSHGGGGFLNKIGDGWLKNEIFGFNIFELHSFIDWVGEWGVSRALACGVLYCGLLGVLSLEVPNLPLFTIEWMLGTAPLWLPVMLIIGAWHVWIWYIQALFLAGRKPILLEMKIPREITKSPRAMELAFANFSLSSGETTFFNRAWKGGVRPFFSFEIASFGGEIHFYIWCWDNYKRTVESALYAQYPEIELHQVEDYAAKFRFEKGKYDAWGVEWPLIGVKKIDDFKVNAYPIKTYIDFELDKDPKEEYKVDPLAQTLEFMGSIQPHEQIWAQIVIRKCGGYGILRQKQLDDKWKKMVAKEVETLRVQSAIVSKDILHHVLKEADLDEEARPPQVRPSWKQQKQMESMERNLGKYPFEVGTRGIYWTTKELHGPTFTGMRWMWRAFGNPQYMTHMRPRRWHCDFDFAWQDFHKIRWNNQTRRVLDAYRRRSFFHSPWVLPTNIMTNEVLASIWHPPSATIKVPGLARIPAIKSEPPSNLPK